MNNEEKLKEALLEIVKWNDERDWEDEDSTPLALIAIASKALVDTEPDTGGVRCPKCNSIPESVNKNMFHCSCGYMWHYVPMANLDISVCYACGKPKEQDDEEITNGFWRWCEDIGDPIAPSAHAAWNAACAWMGGK